MRAQLFQNGSDIGELRLRVACDQLLTKSSRVASEELLKPSDIEGTHILDNGRVSTTSAENQSQNGIQSNCSILLARKESRPSIDIDKFLELQSQLGILVSLFGRIRGQLANDHLGDLDFEFNWDLQFPLRLQEARGGLEGIMDGRRGNVVPDRGTHGNQIGWII